MVCYYTLLCYIIAVIAQLSVESNAQEMDTIRGTIYCNNDFSLYINGELIVEDPIPDAPHNAINVSFTVPSGQDIVFAIEGRDLADSETGLELNNRCLGNGGLRAVFSNGVVTNGSWVCTTQHYGPVNWKQCYGAQTVRDQSLQLLPECMFNTTPPLVGCVSRVTERPEGWIMAGFDDSRWDFALEYEDEMVGWGLRPPGCEVPGTTVSSELDPSGEPIICPEFFNWGDSKFIWRPDLDLDNTILCRYVFSQGSSIAVTQTASVFLVATIAFFQLFLVPFRAACM